MSVYFATCREVNVVKIGNSHEPHSRIKEIQVGCPFDVVIEATMPGNHEQEKALHRRFADDRLRGEWFRITPLIDAMIQQAKEAEAARPKVPQINPPGFRQTASERRQERKLITEQQRRIDAGNTYLRRLEAKGEIHFPFRVKEEA